ncbi:UNVERIFIED_CONTAM: hypothetical protein PYX00_001478 [Menopon gallinae]|uniref:EGF-like domain-containing protein n=1 Tax=Menopon gallinae TaxID=328185 RepID=A0AAW2IED6_9NEOP
MLPFLWISLALLITFGKCEGNPQVRHERTRYLTLGSRYHVGNDTNSDPYYPIQVPRYPMRPTQESRPLFSWDTPTQEFSAAPPLNYRGNISAVKPTYWHGRKKQKPSIKRAKAAEQSRSRGSSVSFRKSYVYKAIPPEEEKPKPSKKVIYVVSRRNERRKGGHRRKQCKDPQKCRRLGNEVVRYKPSKWRYGKNEVVRAQTGRGSANDVDHFPKGLIVEGLEELRNNRRYKKPKTFDRRVPQQSGICLTITEKCEQICTEEAGQATCSCYPGFTVVNGTKCVDIDECRTNNGGCDWKCVNTPGSRRCLCPDGYRLTDDRCIDVNECLLRNGHGPCQDTCINTMGGYYCTCDGLKGTVLAGDNHTCEEVNDCNTGAAGCSHSCISTFGRSFCTCPDGYELGDDWKTCHDIDECKEQEEHIRCEFGCVNTMGSYYCEMGNALSGG